MAYRTRLRVCYEVMQVASRLTGLIIVTGRFSLRDSPLVIVFESAVIRIQLVLCALPRRSISWLTCGEDGWFMSWVRCDFYLVAPQVYIAPLRIPTVSVAYGSSGSCGRCRRRVVLLVGGNAVAVFGGLSAHVSIQAEGCNRTTATVRIVIDNRRGCRTIQALNARLALCLKFARDTRVFAVLVVALAVGSAEHGGVLACKSTVDGFLLVVARVNAGRVLCFAHAHVGAVVEVVEVIEVVVLAVEVFQVYVLGPIGPVVLPALYVVQDIVLLAFLAVGAQFARGRVSGVRSDTPGDVALASRGVGSSLVGHRMEVVDVLVDGGVSTDAAAVFFCRRNCLSSCTCAGYPTAQADRSGACG